MLTPIVKAALGAAVIAIATAANAASDYLLELDGIKGESKATASIETFQWPRAMASGVFNPFQPALAGGVSVATGDITGDLASDTRWDALELTARSPQGEPYYTYKLKVVLVSSWQSSAANDGHKEWIIIESASSPIMCWRPPLAHRVGLEPDHALETTPCHRRPRRLDRGQLGPCQRPPAG